MRSYDISNVVSKKYWGNIILTIGTNFTIRERYITRNIKRYTVKLDEGKESLKNMEYAIKCVKKLIKSKDELILEIGKNYISTIRKIDLEKYK